MEKKYYYCYAGYYEVLISAKRLRAPFVQMSRHRSFEAAVRAAERLGPEAIVIDEALREEHEAITPEWMFLDGELMYQTFAGTDKYLENGLSEYTKYVLERRFDCQPRIVDLQDIVEYLKLKLGWPQKKAVEKTRDKTYRELYPMLEPLIA